jgi:hypothetical protein
MNCYNHGNICAQKWPWLAFLEFNPLNLGHLGQIAKAWPQLSAKMRRGEGGNDSSFLVNHLQAMP